MLRSAHSLFSRLVGWPLFGMARPFVRLGARHVPESASWFRLSQAEADAQQLELLRRLLQEACASVPYYRELLRQVGAEPAHLRSYADVRKIPPLDRQTVQARCGDLCTERGDVRLVQNASGGSSGAPVIVYQTLDSQARGQAWTEAADMIAGYQRGRPLAVLWGGQAERSTVGRFRTRLSNWMRNTGFYDTFDMEESRMERYHAQLTRQQPDLILAYASSLYLFARFLEATGRRAKYPRKAMIASAEMLTASMRADIERVFPVRVYNRYGSRETGIIGMECEYHDGLHVVGGNVLLEVVDPSSFEPVRNQPGEVLVTTLWNYGMPLIRYAIGDNAILSDEPCRCGRPGPIIKEVLGRTSETLRMASGTLVHGEYFTHLLYGLAGVKQFRFVQNSLSDYDLMMVTDSRYDKRRDRALQEEIMQVTGPDSTVRVLHVDRIDPLPSGKQRFVLSKLDPASQQLALPAGS